MPVHGTGRVRWLLLVGVPAAASELPAGAFGGRAELQAAPNPAARASGGLMHNPPSSAAKPHIVALIADDLGWANVRNIMLGTLQVVGSVAERAVSRGAK